MFLNDWTLIKGSKILIFTLNKTFCLRHSGYFWSTGIDMDCTGHGWCEIDAIQIIGNSGMLEKGQWWLVVRLLSQRQTIKLILMFYEPK